MLCVATPRPRLSRDAILDAALEIIDDGGLEACTMRAVAADLGVEAMSLYWHVPGKEALLDGVVQRMLSTAPPYEHSPEWRAELNGIAHAIRGILLEHPNAIPLLAGRALGSYAAASKTVETAVETLERAGFDRATAIRASRTVYRYVVGFFLVEGSQRPGSRPPSPATSPILADVADSVTGEPELDLFEYGLQTMLDGLEAGLRRRAPE
jgi:TetR/AcrR family tetracycline transcriptional repressor